MKLLLINPPRYKDASVTREGRCELLLEHRIDTPATLLIMASILREQGHEVNLIDANGFDLKYDVIIKKIKARPYQCIVFTFNSLIIEEDMKTCDIAKSIDASIVCIGYSWYSKDYGKDILKEFHNLDILINGDPFTTIKDLVEVLNQGSGFKTVEGISFRTQDGRIVVNPDSPSHISFEDLPLPAYDLLPSFKPYYIYTSLMRPYALIYAGKGCPYGCAYCNVARTKYTGRSAKKIVEELRLLKKLGNIKYVWFYDEIFTIKRGRIIEICNALVKERLNIKWFCDSRADLVDEEMLRLMRKAGCIGISYGIESGSPKILNAMNKGITIEQAKKSLLMTRKAKIPFQLNLIIGYMGEDKQTLQENELLIRKVLPDTLQVTKMMALEGTEFMNLARKQRWVKDSLDWKTRLKEHRLKLQNYPPFELKLYDAQIKYQKFLYYNPKWWMVTLRTLIYNPVLIIPTIMIFLRMIKSRRFLSGIIT